MAHLLRGKQSGIQHDLSAGLDGSLFKIDDIARYGINSQTSALAYDPVQSLLAIGTKSSQFGPGQIYVFGRNRIQVVLQLPVTGASVKELQFCADKLIALDTKHDVSIFSLELKRLITSYSPPGVVTALCTDPMLDYAFLGMQTGEVLAYDLDREHAAPFRIPLLWQEMDPRARVSPIVSLQLHPRDVGQLLIGYTHGAAIYSFKANKSLRCFLYEVPRGAPGGDGDPAAAHTVRRPRLVQAVWHPTGTFIMTGHEDSSIVFWDTVKDGRMLMARTLTDTNVATPGANTSSAMGGSMAVKEPLFKMAWCANKDPEDTAILIAGGSSTQSPQKGLCLLEMGRTPVYQTSRWEDLATYLENPKRQRILPTPPGAEVIGFCLIPRETPHFNNAHDPIALIALMASGEILTLTFPSGIPVSPTNQLHVSVSFVSPFVRGIRSAQIGREKWLGLQERRSRGPAILKGGAELPRSTRRYERRMVVQTIHADGTVRIWDLGYGDEIENDKILQVDVARAVGLSDGVDVTQTSFAGESSELAVGLASGELIVFRWGVNRNAGRDPPPSRPNQPGALTSVTDRIEPSLSEGLIPLTLLDQRDGPVRAVCMSEIGFVAAGFEGGSIAVIDLRGPAIIYNTSLQELGGNQKGGGLRKRMGSITASSPSSGQEHVTFMQFSIMTLEGENYSSILLHVGTSTGRLATFKILPDSSGRFTVQYAGAVSLDSRLIHIAPINTDDGSPASATQITMAALRSGHRVNGALVAVTPSSIHIFKPASAKGAHKSFDNYFCDAAAIVRYQDRGHAILGLFGDGTARAYAIPSIKEIASTKINDILDVRRLGDAVITPTGNILGFTSPSELAVLNVWGAGNTFVRSQDKLFNPEALIPPRPTISNVQWITGTQYVTPADMDVLIGGPTRPPSKRMIDQQRADEAQRKLAGRSGATGATMQQDEGYWAYMQRQVQERTERLGFAGEGIDNLEETSQNWLEDVNKFVNRQKRNAAGSIIKAKFGL
ncbi:snare-dependent exocytosis protein [Neohortaea acidophila]|uniref:Snare-dependent exocytosis protein n=1 Tax=Neohortaea acidophila TaxID=245834 RepID=A0A6A6PP83_9PEZI|nr:snare-dependent exocytosis protein [Neohortaea acidophila]KAF2481501.1 snare-dependent exocytosis protein [Neohortaea acidophila]